MSDKDKDKHKKDVAIIKALSVEKKRLLLKGLGLSTPIPTIISYINDDDVYSVQDVADFLKYSPQQIRRLCRQDKLHAVQVEPKGKYIIFGQHIKEFITKYFYRDNMIGRLFDDNDDDNYDND